MPDNRRWQIIKLGDGDYAAHGVLIQGPRCEDEFLVPEAEVDRLRTAIIEARRLLEAAPDREGRPSPQLLEARITLQAAIREENT